SGPVRHSPQGQHAHPRLDSAPASLNFPALGQVLDPNLPLKLKAGTARSKDLPMKNLSRKKAYSALSEANSSIAFLPDGRNGS
ncbi:hypothetical protein AB0N07_50040, partial [Streptomyces sp. NPDC051172]|uniref:hypothetical protein n=1 Tax=Streptomyces sp. NPDC051172 TaxID=3155796 RepID=UPI003438B7AB